MYAKPLNSKRHLRLLTVENLMGDTGTIDHPVVLSRPVPLANYVPIQEDKGKWLQVMSDFYDHCHQEAEGRRMLDFTVVAGFARSSRPIAAKDLLGPHYFMHRSERQHIVEMFYNRRQKMNEQTYHYCRKDTFNSALCWAILQVANKKVMEKLKISLEKPEEPVFFRELEQIMKNWQALFRICRLQHLSMFLSVPVMHDGTPISDASSL